MRSQGGPSAGNAAMSWSRSIDIASKKGREASVEVSDVSHEFPGAMVLNFSMSDRPDDTL